MGIRRGRGKDESKETTREGRLYARTWAVSRRRDRSTARSLVSVSFRSVSRGTPTHLRTESVRGFFRDLGLVTGPGERREEGVFSLN